MSPPPGRSLEGLHATVPVPHANEGFWKQWRAFTGPAFLVSVGYMDPGNWATDLQGGAVYRYELLWVVALSSAMAVIMQIVAARLGVVTGKDLAQACRDFYWPWTRWPLWLACEVAIMACDLAEVLGSAVAINLLFHIPLFWAVIITAFDVLLLLGLQGLGMRFIEALILVLVLTIGGCYFAEIFILPQTQPDFLEMGQALLTPGFRQEGMILVAIGIIGATVMPHNLYLHSALVQSRQLRRSVVRGEGAVVSDEMPVADEGAPHLSPLTSHHSPATDEIISRAIKFNGIDTVAALSVAFLVNAAILVLAAMVFNGRDSVTVGERVIAFDKDTDWVRVAYLTLSPLLGTALASVLFAIALFASGQSSTITGTLAGQVVMEGFMRWRIRPWVRRLSTRLLAIIPAVVVIGTSGESSVTDLLVLSQIVLALQLPFAMFPLLHFTSSRKWMGRHRNGWFLLAAGWTSFVLITSLNVYGLVMAAIGGD